MLVTYEQVLNCECLECGEPRNLDDDLALLLGALVLIGGRDGAAQNDEHTILSLDISITLTPNGPRRRIALGLQSASSTGYIQPIAQ